MARQITLELLADSSKFESGMKDAARAADRSGDKIEDAAEKAGRMQRSLDGAGEAADNSEGKFMATADVLDGLATTMGFDIDRQIQLARGFGDLAGGAAGLLPTISGLAGTLKTGLGGAMTFIAAHPMLIALALFAAAFVVLWKNSETFRDIVKDAFDVVFGVIKGVWDWVRGNWPLLLAVLTGPIGIAVHQIVTHWDTIRNAFTAVKDWIGARVGDIVGFFTGLGGRISAATSGMWDGIKDAFRGAINWIIDRWNGLEFGLPKVSTPFGDIGGFTLGTPDLRRLAGGGVAYAGRPHLVGERGPELFVPGRTGTVVPGGGGITIVVQGSVISERDLGRVIADQLRNNRLLGVT